METKGPTVSVIISAHNRPAYLMEALKSLQGQTAPFDKFEVIVVKDYELDLSKIDVGKMAVTFIDTSDSYLVLKHIAGIKASRGDYIALMDDDDLFSATKIERILSLSQYMGRRSFYVNAKEFFTNKLEDFSVLSQTSSSSFEIFDNTRFNSRKLNRNIPWYNLSSMTIGRDLALEGAEIIRGFKREIDPLWYLIGLENADKIVYDSSRLTFYRRHSGGVSRSDNKDKICNYAVQAIESYDEMLHIFRSRVTLETIIEMRTEWQIKASSLGCKIPEYNSVRAILTVLKSLQNHSIKDSAKLLLLFLLSRVSIRISSGVYPKFYM
jgi:glycosyltransferase involved in cell wall biosynthesis